MNQKTVVDRQDLISRIASCFAAGQMLEAECLARQLLEDKEDDELAVHLLAQVFNQRGKFSEAIDLMRRLLGINPNHAGYHNDFGVMQAALGRWSEAETAYRMSLNVDPSGGDARFNLALMLFRQKKIPEALAELDVLEKATPGFPDIYALRAEILLAEGFSEEAKNTVAKIVELGLERVEVLVNLSASLIGAGCTDEAETLLTRALQIAADDPAANYYLGNILRLKGKMAEAATYFQQAIVSQADFAEAHNNLGLTLQELGNIDAAERAYKRALESSPHIGAVHNNLGNCYLKQGRVDAALASFLKAVECAPDLYEAWNNLGELYCRTQRLDEGEAAYRKALELKPASAEAGLNLGILLLLRGDFEEGWHWYEKRWEMPAIRAKRPQFAQPEWMGEPLDGKTLLIYVEQGMGDNLQFVRYLRVLRDIYPTARIYYWCLKPLFRLFSAYAAECGVDLLPETVQGGVPPIDFHIALLTVPERIGTTLNTIPAEVPYLAPPADLVSLWAVRLAGLKGKKVGLVWGSGETYLFHMFRTMQLHQLKPLLAVEGISWVSLQKGPASSQIAAEGLGDTILDLMDETADFSDTAAIIANLDLVISVDTSVPHLAGAMGVPVWLLDRFDTDWRWLLDREDSPWYPTMRIFRQTSFADWSSVVPRVVEALSAWVSNAPVGAKPLTVPSQAMAAAVNRPTASETGIKLNLGCGSRKMSSFINVDCEAVGQPDMVVDLEKTPWPWESDSVDEIKLIHVLEHLGQSTAVFLSIIKEMYRVCRQGARIEITVPHPRSDHYLGDPTHVRPVTLQMLCLFDQRMNRECISLGAADTPLGIILDVDFEIMSAVHLLDPEWRQKLSSGQINETEIESASRQYNNVVESTTFVWRVHKGR